MLKRFYDEHQQKEKEKEKVNQKKKTLKHNNIANGKTQSESITHGNTGTDFAGFNAQANTGSGVGFAQL